MAELSVSANTRVTMNSIKINGTSHHILFFIRKPKRLVAVELIILIEFTNLIFIRLS